MRIEGCAITARSAQVNKLLKEGCQDCIKFLTQRRREVPQ